MAKNYRHIRLYVEGALHQGALVQLSDKQIHYLLHVMRLEEGQHILVFNGKDGEWHAHATKIHKKSLELEVKEQKKLQYSAPEIHLIFSPIRTGNIDFLVEKSTEIGVSHFHPVIYDHTSVRKINHKKLLSWAIEASEQSERTDIPIFRELQSFDKLLNNWDSPVPVYYGNESGKGQFIETALNQNEKLSPTSSWAIMVGPEGGFSEREFKLLDSRQDFHGVSLGPRILRAETAAITLAILTISRWGDWNSHPHFCTEKNGTL